MAKLTVPETAGFNAGKNFYSKPGRIRDIIIVPEISKIFAIQENTLKEVTRSIKENGYDKSQPVVVWKEKNILVDGHTRLAAARNLGLEEIPVAEMEFESREDALLYAFERQAVRRNLSSAEILAAAEALEKKARDGRGRAAERLAERLGVSAALVYQARKITKEAPPEVVDAVKKGERSIKSAYGQITGKKPEKKPGVTEGKPSESAGIPPVLPKSGFDRIRLIEEIEEAVTMIDMNAADTAKIRGLLERVRGCLVTDTGQ